MVLKSLVVAAALIAALNPRVAIDAGRPVWLVSCSTGASLHWLGLQQQNGLVGLHGSMDGIRRDVVMKPCFGGMN